MAVDWDASMAVEREERMVGAKVASTGIESAASMVGQWVR